MKKFISDFMKYSTGAKIALAAAAVLTFLLGIFAGNAIQSGRASAALARMGKAETQFNLELSRRNDDLRRLADTLAERQIELDGLNGLKLTIDSETDLPPEADAPAPDEGQDEDAPAPAPVSTPDPSTSIRSGGWVKVFLLLFIAVVILATLIYIIVIIAGGRKKEEYDDDDDYDDEEEDYEDDDEDYGDDEEEFDGDTDGDYDDEEDPDDDE